MEIIFSTLGTVGEGGIQSSLEFCMCGSGFGPNCRTFCRLSPIHRHFLAPSYLLRCLPPLWLHLSQTCLSVGWRKYAIFAKKRGLCSARWFTSPLLAIVRALCASFRDVVFARENQNTSGEVGKVVVSFKWNVLWPLEPGWPSFFPQRSGRVTEPR